MSGTESLFSARARRIFERLAEGQIDVATARRALWGVKLPRSNEPARLLKEGRWASGGGYPTGDEGARQAAHDALRIEEFEPDQRSGWPV